RELLKNGRGAEIFSGSNFGAQKPQNCGQGTNMSCGQNVENNGAQNAETSSHYSPLTSHHSGITLIALIITIVIMLILAGITINLTLGENGIFQRAKLAKSEYETASVQEQLEMDSLRTMGLDDAITDVTIEEYINNLKLEGLEEENIKERFTINQKKEYGVVIGAKVYSIYAEKNGIYVKLEKNHNILMADNDAFSANDKFLSTGLYRSDINSVNFATEKRHLEEGVVGYSDVTALGHPANTVMAWWKETSLGSGKYDVTIGSEGGVIAPIISRGLFYNMGITSINFENLDVSETINLTYFVANNSNLTTLELGDNFDTSNVVTTGYMFWADNKISSLDLGNKFDTINVIDMGRMFQGCQSLTYLNLGNKFDTTNVTYMGYMFCELYNITELNLGDKFSTKSVTNLDTIFAFQSASSQTGIKTVNLYLGVFGEEMDNRESVNTNDMFYNFGTQDSRIYTKSSEVKEWLKNTVHFNENQIIVRDY
ncbi:MAG: BspA family leucine-rich repeat surface protein, partial [Clostridia bacterium]|nr:BspA family leucine-rich repeat surface protein [Clostridia bacterium]